MSDRSPFAVNWPKNHYDKPEIQQKIPKSTNFRCGMWDDKPEVPQKIPKSTNFRCGMWANGILHKIISSLA